MKIKAKGITNQPEIFTRHLRDFLAK